MVPQSARRGLLFAVCAILIFSAQDGLSKHLASHYPPVFIAMLRYWGFALFLMVWLGRQPGGLRAAATSSNVALQLFRGALLGGQIVLAITAFAEVGLAATMALFAAAPLLVAALSVPVLGEHVGWRRWLAIAVGFLGVLLIIRPGPELLTLGPGADIWLAVLATVGIAVYGVLTRLLSRTDGATTSFFYTGVGGMLLLTLVGPFYWTWLEPMDWLLMLLLCITGTSGHYLLIRALEATEAVVIQPVNYLQTVLGTMIGVMVFGEVLEWPVVVGALIVVAAGLFAAWRELVRNRARLVP